MQRVDSFTDEIFADWLYTRKLPTTEAEWNENDYPKDGNVKTRNQWYIAAQLAMLKEYAFAHRMLCPELSQEPEYIIVDLYTDDGGLVIFYEVVIYAFSIYCHAARSSRS